jgi:hypothetical protein
MSILLSEISKPAPARPWFERHRHRGAFVPFVGRTELFEQGSERVRDRRSDEHFFGDVQREVIDTGGDCGHASLLLFFE